MNSTDCQSCIVIVMKVDGVVEKASGEQVFVDLRLRDLTRRRVIQRLVTVSALALLDSDIFLADQIPCGLTDLFVIYW